MNKEDIFKIIVQCSREVIPDVETHAFAYDDCLKDLGANSVDRAEIITMVMEELSLEIPRVALFGAKNIGELVEVLYEKTRSA